MCFYHVWCTHNISVSVNKQPKAAHQLCYINYCLGGNNLAILEVEELQLVLCFLFLLSLFGSFLLVLI